VKYYVGDYDDEVTYDDTDSAERRSLWKEDTEPVQLLGFSSSSVVVAPTFAKLSSLRCNPSEMLISLPTTVCAFYIN